MASADRGIAQIGWARRSMPLSAAATAVLIPDNDCHIGMGLPVDPASSSLALWLLDTGFKVSVLTSHSCDKSADLLAVLEASGADIFEDHDGFIGQMIDIMLDIDGGLLEPMCGQLKGATVLSEDAAETVPSLPLPIIDLAGSDLIKDSALKHGIGQACVSGFLDITNLQIAGREVLVLGYGAIGEGVAKFANAYGARVMVCEDVPARAIRAQLDGHSLMKLPEALPRAEVVFCSSPAITPLGPPELGLLPDGALLCSSLINPSINPFVELLKEAPEKPVRDHVSERRLPSGKVVKLVAKGMPIHIETGRGLPFEYADVVMAAQLHAIQFLTKSEAENGLQKLPLYVETALAAAMLGQE